MGQSFDPYYNWLGIPEAEQPPNYYRLLGLAPLEGNLSVIEHAADRVMIHLRTFAAGPNGAHSQRLLNEVSTARGCLLDTARKARYDADLQARLGLTPAPAVATSRLPPMPRAAGTALPKAMALPAEPMQVAMPMTPMAVVVEEPIIAVNRTPTAASDGPTAAPRKTAPGKVAPGRRPDEISNPQAAAIIHTVKIVMGGLGGLSMAILLVWVVFGIDALGLFSKEGDGQVAVNPNPPPPAPKPVDPVDSGPPVKPTPVKPTPVKPTPVDPTPAPVDPTDPANPFQPVLDPTVPAVPMPSPAPVVTPTNPVSPPVTPPAVDPQPAVNPAAPADARHPVPTNDEQRVKIEEFKSYYPKEFADAERPPAREKFPDFLIAKADGIKSDPVARFAILREAYTRLIKAKDFALAVEIVDRLEQEYKVDELAMRVLTVNSASAAGRPTAAEKQALAMCAADLAEVALRRQRIAPALEMARMAENMSKALQNKAFRERTITLKEEVEKAQAEWGPVERARKALAAAPDDAAAALVDGRYRCLVAGDWGTGLPVLAKGGADPLAIAARLDLAGASDPRAAATIADAWFDLAKSDDKLKPLYARALHWYRQAVATSTGADQVPWLQRVEQVEGLNLPERYFAAVHDSGTREPLPPFVSMFFRNVAFEPIDCFKFVLLPELRASPWNLYSTSAASMSIYSKPDIVYGKVPTHVPNVPREYQVGVRVSQYYSLGKDGPFVIGMVGPKGPFAVVVDMPISTEFCTFVTMAEAKTPEQNPTLVRYPRQHLAFGDEPVLVQVRRNSVTVQIQNRDVTQFEGDLDRLTMPAEWTIPKFNGLLLGAHQGSYRVSSWFLEPVAPTPRLAQPGTPPDFPGLPEVPPLPLNN